MAVRNRVFAIVAGLAPVLMLMLAFANHTFNADRRHAFVLACFGVLFLSFVYALVPLLLAVVLRGQVRIGNGDVPLVRWLSAHHWHLVCAVWLVFSLGLLVALPYLLAQS